ncbi:hypothetical protein GW884_00635 [Candidatus Falkowbacteria bacterium]|nr:hypothetical protein [Candidatus Falkowbacteria bacterium]
MAVILLIAIFFVALDRFLKSLAIARILTGPIKIWGDILKFNLTTNYNIAFSLPLPPGAAELIIIAIVSGLIYYFIKLYLQKAVYSAGWLAIIIFGATSNLVDRLNYGYVIDYFDLKYFTVFNLADAMIVVGSLLLLIIFYKKQAD